MNKLVTILHPEPLGMVRAAARWVDGTHVIANRRRALAARRAGGMGVSPVHPLFSPASPNLGKGAEGLGLCDQAAEPHHEWGFRMQTHQAFYW